ncbi:MAG: hypothetical protein Kow00124_16620 [Anaerolineae bacterium]
MPRLLSLALAALLLAGCAALSPGPETTPTPSAPPVDLPAPTLHTFEATSTIGGTERAVELPYLVYEPVDYDPDGGTRYPLLIMLHGAGLDSSRIADLDELPSRPDPLRYRPYDFPFLYVFPFAPPDNTWVDIADVMGAFLDMLTEDYPVDPDRVYLAGYSMGGGGAWVLGALYTDRLTAIAAIAGGWPAYLPLRPVPSVCDIGTTPVWAAHSRRDEVVGVFSSDHLVSRLQTCGGTVVFDRYEDENHSESIVRALNDPALYEWLLAQASAQAETP